MKRTIRKFLTVLISILLIVSYTGTALAEDLTNGEYAINEAYQYPIVPGAAEWASFTTRMQKVEACQIPESILKNMTTKALVETVMNYPLLVDIFAWNTKQEGFEAVCSDFNGLQELMTRQDVFYEFEKYANKLTSYDVNSLSSKKARTKHVVQSGSIEILLYSFNPKKDSLAVVPLTDGTVYTPKGTAVPTYVGYTWASHGIDGIIADTRNDAFQEAYPNATLLREEYPSYNCHSYAWYSTSSTNQHWMISPNAYMTDGSYRSVGAAVGCKAYYGKANHSAIVTGVGGGMGPNVGVISKWGPYGLYAHKILDCPYAKNATVSFWKLN